MDSQIETGSSWPQSLAQAHARSKLMVAVLSRDYFLSPWCRLEFALMRRREKTHKFRTVANPSGLIVPVIIDDGDCFPLDAKEIQGQSLHRFANPFIRMDSPKQEELAEELRTTLCPTIQQALQNVPDFDSGWETVADQSFGDEFTIQMSSQTSVPAPKMRIIP
jgi:hypothetical protein